MSRISNRSVAELPQSHETWQVVIAQLRTWISSEDRPPFRPYGLFVFVVDTGFLLTVEVIESQPTLDQVRNALFKAMAKPRPDAGRPRRPYAIGISDPDLAEGLTHLLSRAKIEMVIIETVEPEGFQEVLKEFESFMHHGKPELPGLLSVKGVTPELVAGFFAAAAEFYRAASWVRLTNDQVIAVRHPAEPNYRYAVVMGNAGVEYGLAMYLTWEDIQQMFSPLDSPMESMPKTGAHSMFYERIEQLPFDDLGALEAHGWEVAGDEAYPIPVVIERGEGARRPDLIDLLWYEAALRAIPITLRDQLRPDGQGDYQPIETLIEVTTHAGPIQVGVKYPAGEMPLEARPAHQIDWSELTFGDEEDFDEFDEEFDDEFDDEFDEEIEEEEAPPVFFDRRGMEGMMQQIAAQAGAVAGSGDPDLDRAQEIMYRAWSESNPARRIALAHEALAISSNCADAYVLLAEEEADTVGRALNYYRQGVTAGERALGEDFFKHETGYFWGILETRPYMRAKEGLASTLWRLNRKAEAIEQYRDMLRLNPNDNQGARYLLLDLLLHLDRDEEATQLVRTYRGEWSAVWHYTRALLEFRKRGASARANQALAAALGQNRYVPAYLTGKERIPRDLPPYIGMGDEAEAVAYAADHLNHWRRTPDAVAWLTERLKAQPAPSKQPKSRTKPKSKPTPKRAAKPNRTRKSKRV